MRNTKRKRPTILARDNFKCVYCRSEVSEATVELDHVLAKRRGGNSSMENLVSSCSRCNAIKSDLLLDDFIEKAFEREAEAIENAAYYRRVIRQAQTLREVLAGTMDRSMLVD